MMRLRSILPLLLASFAPGCASCGEEDASSGEQAAGRETPAAERPEVPAPTAEQLPLPQDFALHAGQQVTEENYAAELERLEREIGAILTDEAPVRRGPPAAGATPE